VQHDAGGGGGRGKKGDYGRQDRLGDSNQEGRVKETLIVSS